MQTMKALTVLRPGVAEIRDVPCPMPEDDMIRIKVVCTGVCATDYAIYTGDCSFVRSGEIVYPVRIGHEYAGIVDAVGSRVTGFKPGDRVFTENGVACGTCPDCLDGRYEDCKYVRSVGTVKCWDGSYAEYMYMPERHVYHLPDNIGFDAATLLEPASISIDAFTDFEMKPDTVVVVTGTGAIGMSAAWIARYLGAGRVIMAGRSPAKLEIARKIGADDVINMREENFVDAVMERTDKRGAGLLIETTGDRGVLNDCIRACAKRGRVSAVSFYEQDLSDMPIDHLVLYRISLRGAAGGFGAPARACEIMKNNPVDLTPIITHRIPFANCLDVFENEKAYHATKIKALITF